MHATLPLMRQYRFPALRRERLETLQVNLGYKCNQSCVHCHVNAGPSRTEMMSRETVVEVLNFLESSKVRTLDITGGAPELHPQFRELVARARGLGAHVIDRCNLTVLEEPGKEDLAVFLKDARGRDHCVATVLYGGAGRAPARQGRLPGQSIRALKQAERPRLRAQPAAQPGVQPAGPDAAAGAGQARGGLQALLGEQHGIVFNKLYTLANMPIQRFGSMLVSKGKFGAYMELLHASHRDENLASVMCRSLVSVDWQGYVYDCDFNQMLGLPLVVDGRRRVRLTELLGRDLAGNPIAVRDHCFGCTAGQGSSCGGALAA